ncbi:Dimer-Tnp-hAT domain containing protein, partial [Pyrenophora tritici-repentis]
VPDTHVTARDGVHYRDGWLDNNHRAFLRMWQGRKDSAATSAHTVTPPRKKPRLGISTSRSAFLQSSIEQSTRQLEASLAEDEYEIWKRQPALAEEDWLSLNPLLYWESVAGQFPILSKFAIDVLTIPAAAADCERTFSELGDMLGTRRLHMKPELISALQSLKSWKRLGIQPTTTSASGLARTLSEEEISKEIVTGISTVIEDLEEQPFTHLKYCLQDANRVAEFSEGNEALIHEYKECLYMNAKLAFINHQSNIVKAKFADKGVHVLLTSAREALLHQVPDPTEIPKLCMAATGIETLRGYLLMQTAASNLRTLHNHIFEALPEISVAINHIIVKFVDEDGYRTMREFLAQELCGLQKRLDALSISTLQERVKAPWNDRDIGRKILPAHKKTLDPWTTRQWPFWTFAKMLRDHGMPTGGICKDYNLNLELARTMHSYIDQWHCTMSSHPKEVTEILDAPVQAIMRELETHINLSTGDPALQRTAADAHKTLSRRIGIAYGVLLAELKKYLNENYLNFTTEKNFYSPVAGVMRPIYEATRTSTQQGKGVHSRQAFYLQQAVISPDTDQTNLREKIARSLVDSQFSFWEKSCNEYIKEVMHQFQEFQRISVELLENDAWISPQHARIRGRLEALLPQFERDLEMIQSKFFETTRRPAVKPIGSELTHNSTQSRPFLTKPCMLELALVATGKGSSRAFSTSSRPVRNLFSPVKPTSFRSSSMFTKPRRRGQGRNA